MSIASSRDGSVQCVFIDCPSDLASAMAVLDLLLLKSKKIFFNKSLPDDRKIPNFAALKNERGL